VKVACTFSAALKLACTLSAALKVHENYGLLSALRLK
jgi:hypothetical protein